MADIRQFIRSELSIIKKEVIESTRSMIRNEIRSISFDSNLWILFLVLIYGPSPRYNLLVTIYQWFTFCTMSNCSLSSTFFSFYIYTRCTPLYIGTNSRYGSKCRYDLIPMTHRLWVLICFFFLRPPTCLFWWAFSILTFRILKIKFAIGQKFPDNYFLHFVFWQSFILFLLKNIYLFIFRLKEWKSRRQQIKLSKFGLKLDGVFKVILIGPSHLYYPDGFFLLHSISFTGSVFGKYLIYCTAHVISIYVHFP